MTTSSAPVVPPPTATHAPAKPKPPVVETAAPVEEAPEPEPQPEPEPASSSVPTFRERGDGNANDAAIAALHQQIGGITRVALTGGDAEMINELSNALRGRGVSIGEGAPIEIRFTGSVERHGLGRKSRSANATVKKNGRPIFNYVMPREEYRVGDSPAEAFARILTRRAGAVAIRRSARDVALPNTKQETEFMTDSLHIDAPPPQAVSSSDADRDVGRADSQRLRAARRSRSDRGGHALGRTSGRGVRRRRDALASPAARRGDDRPRASKPRPANSR